MLDDSLTHTRGASASPGFLLAEPATSRSSRPRNGDRSACRGPPALRRADPPRREARQPGGESDRQPMTWRRTAMLKHRHTVVLAAMSALVAGAAQAQSAPGYIYSAQLLS